jgi:hypothetical protein
MPSWSNTDGVNTKPKWDVERQTRENVQLYIYAGNTAGNNIIKVAYNDGAQNNVANIGVATGQYVYFMANGFAAPGGVAGNGYPGFFASNTQVSAISGNTITLSNNLFGPVIAGWGVEFDKGIVYKSNSVANTYFSDTILMTPTRCANTTTQTGAIANVGNMIQGWNHITKKTNNDGSVRYLKECLVALANTSAANTNSGNTSFGQFVSGV